MEKKSIGFIGGGRITKIFLKAFKNSKLEFDEIVVFDPNTQTMNNLNKTFPEITPESSLELPAKCDIVFIAVHPPAVMDTLSGIKPYLKENSIVVSLAPKITIEKMRSALGGFREIARVNPSAPGIINQGINPVAFADTMSEKNRNSLTALLSNLGKVPVVAESKIEAYAVISAMGSTYFWFQLALLEELGIKYGLDESEVKEVISEMMKGTVNTLFYSGLSPNEVMDLVPVKPIGEYEEKVKSFYIEKLNGIYDKIKP